MRRVFVAVGVIIELLLPAMPAPRGAWRRTSVYGMYSGLALLMDVHYPERPTDMGSSFIFAGSGWQAPLNYGAIGLKEAQIPLCGPPLLRTSYTVLAIRGLTGG